MSEKKRQSAEAAPGIYTQKRTRDEKTCELSLSFLSRDRLTTNSENLSNKILPLGTDFGSARVPPIYGIHLKRI